MDSAIKNQITFKREVDSLYGILTQIISTCDENDETERMQTLKDCLRELMSTNFASSKISFKLAELSQQYAMQLSSFLNEQNQDQIHGYFVREQNFLEQLRQHVTNKIGPGTDGYQAEEPWEIIKP